MTNDAESTWKTERTTEPSPSGNKFRSGKDDNFVKKKKTNKQIVRMCESGTP